MGPAFLDAVLGERACPMDANNTSVPRISDLAPGQVGLVMAPPGVGKTAVLVHAALSSLLAEQQVLHVSLTETVEHVRSHYHEIIGGLARTGALEDRSDALVASERHRVIHSYLDKELDLTHLARNLDMLSEVAQFVPRLLVIDGLSADVVAAELNNIRDLASKRDVPIWVAVRSTQDETPDLTADETLILVPQKAFITIERVVNGGRETLPVRLDLTTHLFVGTTASGETAVRSTRLAGDCTLYSGGAKGAEEAFGIASERWGVQECNFTFDGHKQARDRGRYALSPRELAAGDVSLVYVSRRLNRTYSEGTLIRKVLQTLWHMVSRSQQVFVIGSIQDDGTVVGGTGWSVELARMWNKDLWVFDQDTSQWSHWTGDAWMPGVPVIESHHFTGAGTRYLTEAGREAIETLFERSFGG